MTDSPPRLGDRHSSGEYLVWFSVSPEPGEPTDQFGFPIGFDYESWAQDWWRYRHLCGECWGIDRLLCLTCKKLRMVAKAARQQVEGSRIGQASQGCLGGVASARSAGLLLSRAPKASLPFLFLNFLQKPSLLGPVGFSSTGGRSDLLSRSINCPEANVKKALRLGSPEIVDLIARFVA